jgi:hypothetical protein
MGKSDMTRISRLAVRAGVSVLAAVVLTLGGGVSARAEAPAPAQAGGDFDSTVAVLLSRRCLDCHGGGKPEGGLDLRQRKTALAGGDSGPAVVAGKPDDSLLWQRVRDGEMPPKAKLTAAEKETLRAWIAAGAEWGTEPIDPFRATTDRRAGYDWWSLRPVKAPEPPAVKDAAWPRGAVDRFVLAALEAKGLKPAAEADRRTLIRRLSFDLTGLPPSPEEVEAFVADRSADVVERLVDRLLASPHYGERQARHWLDVVRFGESDGYERDKPRETAWHYRNWVVDAFNRDLPYDEFVRLQLAGDVLRPDDHSAVIATGFLVAGPHDIVVPSSDKMRQTMRQDELEDVLAVIGQGFLGLTVNCARCHDHKFDPVSQKDYYRIAAAVAGVQHGERELRRPAESAAVAKLQAEAEALKAALAALEAPARKAAQEARKASPPRPPQPLAEWDFRRGLEDRLGGLHGQAFGSARADENGLQLHGKTAFVATAPLKADLREKTLEAWVRLADLAQQGGGVIGVETVEGVVFDTIVYAEREPGRWMAGSENYRRTKPFEGPAEKEADKRAVHLAVTYAADGRITAYRDGKPYGQAYAANGPAEFKAGHARVIFGVRHEPAGGNRLLAGTILRARLYDRALSAEEVAASAGLGEPPLSDAEISAQLSSHVRAAREAMLGAIKRVDEDLRRNREAASFKVYAAVGKQPEQPMRVLVRGNVAEPAEVVAPAGVAAVGGGDLGLPPDAPEGTRRVRLAEWITSPANPLFARVIVNRVWQWHFGTGLVDTPSDFGFNGGRPSHPELLDHLAAELVRRKWSLKALHRAIVLSAAYRQSSRIADCGLRIADSRAGPNPQPEIRNPQSIDREGRLLWRFPPKRLEAECVRDAMLAVAGTLDRTVGGRGYMDFRSHFFKGTQFYDPVEQVGPDFRRRTLYRMWARGGRNPFLDVFDCPDTSTTTPRRAATTTPLQALALMNNAFVLNMAEALADRLRSEAGDDPDRQIARAFALAFGRSPTAAESARVRPFLAANGLPALARVLFNANEFLYLD